MISIKTFRLVFLMLIVSLFLQPDLIAQNYSVDNQKSSLKILGTSSLHDWVITAEKQKGNIQILETENFTLEDLKISFDVEALKSGKSGMDKNTQKALNYSDYKTIDFNLNKVKSITKTATGYDVIVVGELSISGTKKLIDLMFNLKKENGTIKLIGEKKLKMTTFNIEPPKALLGTIKTGDDITIQFNTIFK